MDPIIYKEWASIKRQGQWINVWVQITEGIWEAHLSLYVHCQDGLHEAQNKDAKHLVDVTNELNSGIARQVEEASTEIARFAAKERLRHLGTELRLLRGRLADVEFRLKVWKSIPLSGVQTICAMNDPAERMFEVLQLGGSKMLEIQAKSKAARDALLEKVSEAGLRRGASELTMCASTGLTFEETLSMRRNRRHDPRDKLAATASQEDRKLIQSIVQPPEMWASAPSATYGGSKWNSAARNKEEEAKTVKEQKELEAEVEDEQVQDASLVPPFLRPHELIALCRLSSQCT